MHIYSKKERGWGEGRGKREREKLREKKRERYIDKEQSSEPEQIQIQCTRGKHTFANYSASSQCHCISRMVPRWGM